MYVMHIRHHLSPIIGLYKTPVDHSHARAGVRARARDDINLFRGELNIDG